MKKVTITKEDSRGMDEMWCEFFTCPNCQETIPEDSNFCLGCGVKIEWKIDKKKENSFGFLCESEFEKFLKNEKKL